MMTPEPDWRARLARRLMREAWRPLRWPRLALSALVLLVWLSSSIGAALAIQAQAGVHLTMPGQILDLIYAPFLYLVPSPIYAFAHKLVWQEAVARIAGPLVPLLGLVWITWRRGLEGLASLLMRSGASGYAVIFGNNAQSDALAKTSSEAGEPVLLIDMGLAGQDERLAALGAAGVICRGTALPDIGRAGTVAIWQADTADTMARTLALLDETELGLRDLHLAIRSPAMQQVLQRALDPSADATLVRLRPFSPEGNAIRAAMGTSEPLALAVARGQTRVSLCLWGDGDALQWAAEMALRQFWSAQLGPPKLLWVNSTGSPAGDALENGMLVHFRAYSANVFGMDDLPEIASITPQAAIADPAVTWHIVDYGQAALTVESSFALAARLAQAWLQPPPVQPVLRAEGAIAQLFGTSSLAFLPPILPGANLTLEVVRDRQQDEAAAEIHLAYDRQFGTGATTPANGSWRDLPETYVAANRAAADHLAVKRWDAATSAMTNSELFEAMAKAEHNRWSAERLMAGWAPAEARDNARRLHPDLRPWEALSEASRDKDRAQLRGVLAPGAA